MPPRKQGFAIALAISLLPGALASQQPGAPRALKESLRILDRGENWTRISQVAVSKSGNVAIAMRPVVRFYSSTGAALGSFGRPGEGPGEFSDLSYLSWRGDSMVVTDLGLRRLTTIGPDRRLVGTARWDSRAVQFSTKDSSFLGGFGYPASGIRGSIPGATFMELAPRRVNGTGSPFVRPDHRDAMAVVAVTGTNGEGRIVTWMPHDDCSLTVRTDQMTFVDMAMPFCERPRAAVNRITGTVTVIAASAQTSAHTEYTITNVRLKGDTVYSRKFSFVPVSVTADSVKRYVEFFGKAMGTDLAKSSRGNITEVNPGEKFAAALTAAIKEKGVPKQFPHFLDLLSGDDGSIWVEIRNNKGTERLWQIHAANGNITGLVTIPANVKLKVISVDGAAWGISTDDDGVESVVRYQVK